MSGKFWGFFGDEGEAKSEPLARKVHAVLVRRPNAGGRQRTARAKQRDVLSRSGESSGPHMEKTLLSRSADGQGGGVRPDSPRGDISVWRARGGSEQKFQRHHERLVVARHRQLRYERTGAERTSLRRRSRRLYVGPASEAGVWALSEGSVRPCNGVHRGENLHVRRHVGPETGRPLELEPEAEVEHCADGGEGPGGAVESRHAVRGAGLAGGVGRAPQGRAGGLSRDGHHGVRARPAVFVLDYALRVGRLPTTKEVHGSVGLHRRDIRVLRRRSVRRRVPKFDRRAAARGLLHAALSGRVGAGDRYCRHRKRGPHWRSKRPPFGGR
mmetsp:Transcript_10613/g.25923  ORF Transcript_10613/g.25923 Transcript_10613/m.25923 type:complete len:327 (+) Transcript_10613:405-1385(+)